MKIKPSVIQLLNEKVQQYKQANFIINDPISVPHLFSKPQDIEIAGFLTAIISWGNRKSIIQSASKLMHIMQYRPYDFVLNYTNTDNQLLNNYYYRTFQPEDTIFFIKALNAFYKKNNSLEIIFAHKPILEGIQNLREELLSTPHLKRSEKHLPDIKKGSAAKRINMYLRWMVRNDNIDFGIWKKISTASLLIPLDIHTSRSAFYLGLLKNTNSNLTNTLHLTEILKTIDNKDPIKYDFALFGISAYEKKAVKLY